ncbi:AAA family ATPase [Geothrix fuzhouensis]|uniref:cytidylate kinase-like family protein n=1 Tax=Geothrix fuzhouensis TaxID=2966451 RepID=UPI00214784EC|nr:cytidylate kinase-like family protein [Geothrix fuzhouensis]
MPTNRSQGTFTDKTYLDQCLSYIHTQVEAGKVTAKLHGQAPPRPAITISYQAGSGAHELAVKLAGILQSGSVKGEPPWTVFDRHLVEKVLEDHQMSRALAKFIPEDRQSAFRKIMDSTFGVIPSAWEIVPMITETVLHLADAGNVILVGRGANVITSQLSNVFHVRLIGSLAKRLERERDLRELTLEQAKELVHEEDQARGRYVKAHFGVSIEDDLLYHVVINTDRILPSDAAQLIADGLAKTIRRAAR